MRCSHLFRRAGRFRGDARGIAAVEFAFVLPIMLMIFVCTMELAHAIDGYRKVTLLTRTLADLTAQGDTSDPIAAATMTDILATSKLVLTPFATSNVTVVVSALGVYLTTLNAKPRVCSSLGSNASARPVGTASDLTVPAPFQTTGMRYVLVEVSMPYTPMLGSNLIRYLGGSASYPLKVSLPWPLRGGLAHNSTYKEVILPGGAACPAVAS